MIILSNYPKRELGNHQNSGQRYSGKTATDSVPRLCRYKQDGQSCCIGTNRDHVCRCYNIDLEINPELALQDKSLGASLPKDKKYVSAAILPNSRPVTVRYFQRSAYTFVTNTIIADWKIDHQKSEVLPTLNDLNSTRVFLRPLLLDCTPIITSKFKSS